MMKDKMKKFWRVILILTVFAGAMGLGVGKAKAVLNPSPDVKYEGFYTPSEQLMWEKAVCNEDLNAESTEKFVSDAGIANWVSRIYGYFTDDCVKQMGVQTGALQQSVGLIGMLYSNKPASGVEYMADIGRKLNIVKPVYAQTQGTGFQALAPIRDLWKVFRNITYFFFVLIFMGVGLAIMFRVKISPQAVVTIQSAIPKLVIALLLVTFSYAIAGFLIDLMYVIINLMILILGGNYGPHWDAFEQMIGAGSDKSNPNILFFGFSYIFEGLKAGWNVAYMLNPLDVLAGSGVGADFWNNLRSVAGVTLVNGVISAVVLLVLGIGLLFALFRLFFVLLSSYVRVLLQVIFSPLMLLMTAFPGSEGGVGNWLRGLAAELSVFPVTIGGLILASRIGTLTEAGLAGQPERMWVPPPLGPYEPRAESIGGLLVLGILLILPNMVNMIRDALKIPPFKYGTALGAPIGAGAGVLSYPLTAGFGVVRGGISKGVESQIMKRVGFGAVPTETTPAQPARQKSTGGRP